MLTASPVLRTLEKLHTPPRTFLDFDSPFHLLVATILSAQCTDKRVNLVTPALFKKYPGPADVVAVPEEELKKDIFTCGHYNNKAKYIRATCNILLEKFGGEVPQTMEELLTLPGVGRKTATVVLYAAFKQQEGIAVDTHVWRVSKRLGLTTANSQDKIELDLMRQTPREKWGLFHTLLIMHGRTTCTARNRQCGKCVFKKTCPSSLVMGRGDLAQ
ncbi:endonuclease III [Candidatus Peribacteria bacterium]|nr:endonuclease III [Candidatus Peribacteria bacterium]